jgi:hypothetical protein
MKKIVLRDLSDDVLKFIDERAAKDKSNRHEAVMAILRDAEIERSVEAWVEDREYDDDDFEPAGISVTVKFANGERRAFF